MFSVLSFCLSVHRGSHIIITMMQWTPLYSLPPGYVTSLYKPPPTWNPTVQPPPPRQNPTVQAPSRAATWCPWFKSGGTHPTRMFSCHFFLPFCENVPKIDHNFAGKGDLFGSDLSDDEVSIQSSCDVKSLTYCDLQCILLNKLKDTLIQYPEFAETFHVEIKHDLTYNLKEGFEESEVSSENKTSKTEQLFFLTCFNRISEVFASKIVFCEAENM